MHLNNSTVYEYSSRQTKSTKSHAKLYFALEQSKKVLYAMNVSCPTGVNVIQLGLASLMMSGLMFGGFWKEDYLKDRGGPSLGQVGQFRNRRQSTGLQTPCKQVPNEGVVGETRGGSSPSMRQLPEVFCT